MYSMGQDQKKNFVAPQKGQMSELKMSAVKMSQGKHVRGKNARSKELQR